MGKTFDRLLANAVSDEEEHNSTTHVWFDFHEETRREGLNSLAFLLDSVDDGFFLRTANGSIARLQHGLVRTNCMDCLDRTNVVQTLFAKRALHSQMKTWLLDKNSTAGSKFVRNSQKKGGLHETLTIKDEVESPVGDFSTPELEKAFRNVWSSNGDEVCLSFCIDCHDLLQCDYYLLSLAAAFFLFHFPLKSLRCLFSMLEHQH